MDSGLQGKHALITGAAGGIGSTIARFLAREGCILSLHYNKGGTICKKLISGLENKATCFQADLRSEEDLIGLFKNSIEKYGRIDILVINHGIWPEDYIPILEMSSEQWDNTISINLRSAFLCCREFMKNLEFFTDDYASIVLIGSTAAVFGEAGHADYSISKSGMRGLMLSCKNEIIHVASRGRVNMVSPGWTISPMTEQFMDNKDGIRNVLQTVPLRKIARSDDIAETVVFLSSSLLAGHITGQEIVVAGGMEGRKLFEPEEININKI
ncbi:MAG: SDR family oxidoreductase [Candidatus Heimdallarchaeota archaeon]|nr:SDR family oxidoreductase [Candidatus Heimdallarchaeota archaeon]